MAAGELHVGDVGTQFRFTVYDQSSAIVDVSSATVKYVTFQKPDASVLTQNLGFLTNGTDGILTYTTASGDINLPGIWAFQAFVSMPSGSWYTDVTRFPVYENILM